MLAIEMLIPFIVAAFLMNISPGTSNLYVMARSIVQGISGGIAATVGLAVGALVHVVATVLGLSALFKYSPAFYMAMKLLGAAYLVYLGTQYFLYKSVSDIIPSSEGHLAQKKRTNIFLKV
ncbi:MAG: hypothetical protein GJ671_02340 [Alteromonadaceae bacterium]|nr:hypothetical protein [Alteromonadaceae bacterium]